MNLGSLGLNFNSLIRSIGPAISNQITQVTSKISDAVNTLRQITSGFDSSSVGGNKDRKSVV
jgi:hypothetical protein